MTAKASAPRWSYVERRAAALKLAAECNGFGRPARPEGTPWLWPKRLLPHKQALRLLGAARCPPPDRYGCVLVKDDLRLMAYFEAKEKNQNRDKVAPFI